MLNRSPQAFAVVGPPAGDPLVGMATIDGGRGLAVARLSGVEILEADMLRTTGHSIETRVEWGDAASIPDGARFAVLDMSIDPYHATVRFLDPATGEPTDVELEVPGPFFWTNPTVAISHDGRWVAVSNHREPEEDRPPRRLIWDLTAPSAPPMEIDVGGDTPTVAFSPDGVLVVGSDVPAAGVTAVDPASGDVLASIADARTPVAVGRGGLVGAR